MFGRDDVEVVGKETLFQGYFRIDRYRLRHKLFGGGFGHEIRREVFERGHAAAVLPYDPVRDQVVLIEQFRIGPFAKGVSPWLIETIAGIIDEGETAEEVAYREAVEEAGCKLIPPLRPIFGFFPTPGACSEHIDLFLGRCDSTGLGGVHGLPDEGEDIRVLVLPFVQAMEILDQGHIANVAAIVALQWLARHRDEVRAHWR